MCFSLDLIWSQAASTALRVLMSARMKVTVAEALRSETEAMMVLATASLLCREN